MSKRKKLVLLLVTTLMFTIFFTDTNISQVYANESDIVVTENTFGTNSSIRIVLIGSNVIDIKDGSFSGLPRLREIRVDSENPYYVSFNGSLYTRDLKTLVCMPPYVDLISIPKETVSYYEHALDGVSNKNVEKVLNQINKNSGKVNTVIVTPKPTNRIETTVTPTNTPTPTATAVPIVTPTKVPSNNTTDFSQYVYEDEDGVKNFWYTGTGNSRIIIPDGVKIVRGFGENLFEFNYEIEYIYIPRSVTQMNMANLFVRAERGGDNNMYNILYQCPNLKEVETKHTPCGIAYISTENGDQLYRPGDIYVWSRYEKIPYDVQKYLDFNNRER